MRTVTSCPPNQNPESNLCQDQARAGAGVIVVAAEGVRPTAASIVSHAKLYNCVGPAMLCGMWANSTALAITAEDKAELERIVRSGRTEQRHALRARIILGAAEGRSNNALAKELKTSDRRL